MESKNKKEGSPRRDFLGKLAAGAAAVGIATLANPMKAVSETEMLFKNADDPEAWLAKIKGKHRIAFDVTGPHSIFPFVWPKVFQMTNGAASKDATAVVILRHNAIPYALGNDLWQKYKLGEFAKIDDPLTKAPAVRNPFWQPKPGDYSAPGIGNIDIGINQLMDAGVLFCACHVALTVDSAVLAGMMNLKAEDVLNELTAGVLPGIQVVPSGIWAVNRVQEHGCSYCFVGE